MKIRSLINGDIEILRRLNGVNHPSDCFPDFGKLYGTRVAVDDDSSIVSCAGVRLIAEGIMITDKSKSLFTRRTALTQLLQQMKDTCSSLDQDMLHAFVSDPSDEVWIKILKHYGFKQAGIPFWTRV